MKRRFFFKTGFSTIENLLAAGLFVLLVTLIAGAISVSLEQTRVVGLSERASLVAEEGMEAARSIRDASFALLTDGSHGLAQSDGHWIFSNASDSSDDFTRSIAVSSVDSHTKRIDTTVTWQPLPWRTGSLTLTSYLTNWSEQSAMQSDSIAIDTSDASLANSNKDVRNIEIQNTGQSTITIDKITLTWTKQSSSIERIRIDGDTVWSRNGPGSPSGYQTSGTELNIQNVSIEDDNHENIDLRFTKSMKNETITVTLTMSDQSQKTFTVNPD